MINASVWLSELSPPFARTVPTPNPICGTFLDVMPLVDFAALEAFVYMTVGYLTHFDCRKTFVLLSATAGCH
jgi:hypothetical protein